jgi:hypothetical protein
MNTQRHENVHFLQLQTSRYGQINTQYPPQHPVNTALHRTRRRSECGGDENNSSMAAGNLTYAIQSEASYRNDRAISSLY